MAEPHMAVAKPRRENQQGNLPALAGRGVNGLSQFFESSFQIRCGSKPHLPGPGGPKLDEKTENYSKV
ncbi:MAG: hypothetical protein OXG97_04930 [Candidatus Poribacteria bacterium]|nr:hypothetical protein [Candidatus Poribacteria bacterium]